MSCWVVPSIAAEFWRIPLDQVMDKIRRNALPVRRENGFTFIDILPDPAPAEPLPKELRPPTFTEAPAECPTPPAFEPVAHSVLRVAQAAANSDWVSRNPARLQASSLRRSPSRH